LRNNARETKPEGVLSSGRNHAYPAEKEGAAQKHVLGTVPPRDKDMDGYGTDVSREYCEGTRELAVLTRMFQAGIIRDISTLLNSIKIVSKGVMYDEYY
jgi:hypothetical protein